MNIPKPIPLADLKEGELYFKEDKYEDWSIYVIYIIKIEKILINNNEKRIEYLYSDPKEYYIFIDILGFKNSERFLSSYHLFLKDYIQIKDSNIKYYFYNFDEVWFLKNKRKILLYIGNSFSSKKSFLDIFQEIESEKI